MRKSLWIVITLLVAIVAAPAVDAQDSTKKDPWLSTVSVGFPSIDGEITPMLFTLGANFTKIRPGSLSPDLSIGTMPYALSLGIVPWATRSGVALPIQYSTDVLVLPSVGLSTIIAMSAAGGGALVGSNAGIAMATKGGARVGITWHRFADTKTVMLFEIGVGRLR